MLGIKRKKLALTLLLALMGAGYFGAFSQLELISPLKSYLTLVPVQVGVLIYLLYLRRGDRPAEPTQFPVEHSAEHS
ncbi:hypothetical protein H6G00_22720 [Leptolyngbya sp. FACHB-541]|uniref:hypothetical protein n=1 Tax=Leptolyngbya sp. FACHB-541 TaxID=2692810 RepID=UPI0016849D37|nr:hypothetical protein [Leptolyngbya sp. FACHB-541]MBD1999389.1 hypothetical protein [Leptolyngbya sp. FACHB-541]